MTERETLHQYTKKRLQQLARAEGMIVKTVWTKHELVEQMLKFRGQQSESESSPEPSPETTAETQSVEPGGQRNLEFEAACGGSAEEIPKETRGGARPGGGRPLGSDAQTIARREIADALQGGLVGFHEYWALATKIEEIKITKDEADQLARPGATIINILFPNLRVNEFTGAVFSLVFAVTQIEIPRIQKLRQVQAGRRANRQGGQGQAARPGQQQPEKGAA